MPKFGAVLWIHHWFVAIIEPIMDNPKPCQQKIRSINYITPTYL